MIVNDLLPTIKTLARSYLDEIGPNEESRDMYIRAYINNALRKLASLAYVYRESDPLLLNADGYVTFQRNAQPITDLYAPLRILDPFGQETEKRTSTAASKGWWRESSNTQLHMRGFTLSSRPLPAGNYTLHYIAYPALISSNTSIVEFPDAGQMGLCYYAAGLIVESLEDEQKPLPLYHFAKAQEHLKIAVQANIDARGHGSGGFVPSQNIVDTVFFGGA